MSCKPAARQGDMHTCPMVNPGTPPPPHVGGPISGPGVPTVIIGGTPAATVGDMCVCAGPPDSIIRGSPTVLIGSKPAARLGDTTAHGGIIVAGCPTVLIGEFGMGGPQGATISAAKKATAAVCEPCEKTPRRTALSPPASGASDPPSRLQKLVGALSQVVEIPRYARLATAAAQAAKHGAKVGTAVAKAMKRGWDAHRGGLHAIGQKAAVAGKWLNVAQVGLAVAGTGSKHHGLWQSGDWGDRGEFAGRVAYAGAREVVGIVGEKLGAKGGAILGAKLGALIGSVVPGVGTVAGAAIGAVAGAVFGALAGSRLAKKGADMLVGEERAGQWGRDQGNRLGSRTEPSPP